MFILCFFCQIGKKVERLNGRQVVHIYFRKDALRLAPNAFRRSFFCRSSRNVVLFKFFQYLPCPVRHRRRDPRQTGDLDPEALVCPASHDFAQKDDACGRLADSHLIIFYALDFAFEFGQLVIVSRKESFCTDILR